MADYYDFRARTQNSSPSDKSVRAADDGSLVWSSRYQELAARGKVFTGSVAAVTLPVNAATLASKMGLYNPPGNTILEIIDLTLHAVLATTVVDAAAIYYSAGANATGATFTTRGTTENARLSEGQSAVGQFYSAVTHVGTPALVDIVGGWGAVTDGGSTSVYKRFGEQNPLWVMPSVLIAVAMTTAASTGSGITAAIRWAEIPYAAM